MKVNVTGETMIFRKEYEGRTYYSTSIGQKKQDDEWENASIDVKFKKGVELADKTKINVLNGWLKFYLKDKRPIWQVFISEFEQLSGIPSGFEEIEDYAAVDDSDIPF